MSDSKIQSDQISLEPILWTYSANSEGLHPVKIRVTHRRKPKYYSITDAEGKKIFLTKAQWQAVTGERPRNQNKSIRDRIDVVTVLAKQAAKASCEHRPFSFEAFEKNFLLGGSKKSFYTIFLDHLQALKKEGRIGTMNSYANALAALKRFSKDFMPIDLNSEKLKAFELWMRGQNLSVTTIGIYTRAIRVIYNVCVEQDSSLKELYPFAKGRLEKSKYKIKTGHGSKGDALSVSQLQQFLEAKTKSGSPSHEAKLYWLFSFYCQGMNTNDIFQLRYKNVQWDAIRYERGKTERTETKQEIIEVPLTDDIKKIIVELGNSDKSPDSYVFPLLPRRCSPEQAKKMIHQKNKLINKWLANICGYKIVNGKTPAHSNLDGLTVKSGEQQVQALPRITMYWSRHTYASLLKDAGTPLEMIRELLGHGDLKTTENYVRRFDLDSKRKANASIMKKLA